jgi:hypothetical protein
MITVTHFTGEKMRLNEVKEFAQAQSASKL